MKSFLIIGLGRFGTHLCKDLSKLDNEIMVVDENEAVMEDVLSFVTSAKIGDCTNEKVLATLGVGNFDVCFVCIGSNFQSSLEITIAEKIAVRFSADQVFDYFELGGGFSIYEIPPLPEWIGKSIKDLNFRACYHANIIGIKTDGVMSLLPDANYIFKDTDHLMVLGHRNDIDKILKKL